MRRLLPLAVMLALAGACVALVVVPRAHAGDFVDCSNTADDDGDGTIDLADSGCESAQDDTEGPMTSELAHAAAGRLLDAFYPSVRRLVSCHKRDGRFRCAFKLRQRKNFRYRGVVIAYDREFSGGGGQRQFARLKVIRGTCGRIGRHGPSSIRARGVSCKSARSDIRAFYYRDRPFPYNCFLRPAPATARCKYTGRALSFKYPAKRD